MAELIEQPVEWVDRAPVQASGRVTSTASPDEVFTALARHEGFVEWFPGVKAVEVLGDQREGVGTRRRVRIPGITVEEVFIVWEPGERWAFTGTATSPRWTRSLIEDCRLTPRADGGTDITYTMAFDPVGPIGFVMRHSVKRISASIEKGMEGLARVASTSQAGSQPPDP
jgi:hypothetical protein